MTIFCQNKQYGRGSISWVSSNFQPSSASRRWLFVWDLSEIWISPNCRKFQNSQILSLFRRYALKFLIFLQMLSGLAVSAASALLTIAYLSTFAPLILPIDCFPEWAAVATATAFDANGTTLIAEGAADEMGGIAALGRLIMAEEAVAQESFWKAGRAPQKSAIYLINWTPIKLFRFN